MTKLSVVLSAGSNHTASTEQAAYVELLNLIERTLAIPGDCSNPKMPELKKWEGDKN